MWWPGGSEVPAVAVVEVCGGGAVGCGVIMELRQLKMELIFRCEASLLVGLSVCTYVCMLG